MRFSPPFSDWVRVTRRIIRETFFFFLYDTLVKKINDVSVAIFYYDFFPRRGFGENYRSSAPLLHRSMECFRFFAGLGVRSRHTHGRRYDRFPGVADASEGRPGLPNRPNTAIDQGETVAKTNRNTTTTNLFKTNTLVYRKVFDRNSGDF